MLKKVRVGKRDVANPKTGKDDFLESSVAGKGKPINRFILY